MGSERMTIYRYDQVQKRLFVSGRPEIGSILPVPGVINDDSIESLFEEVLRVGVPAERTVIRENNGSSHTLEVSFVPEYGPDGTMISVIGIAREKSGGSGDGMSMVERLEEEKRALVKEVHHRVNNNLQIVESLLRLQAERFGDSKYLDMLGRYIDRIHAIAMIQKNLCREDRLEPLNFAKYVAEFADYIRDQHPEITDHVEIIRSVEEAGLRIETAVPCALILNELVENSLMHAFPGKRKGRVEIIFRVYGQYCVLEVLDNGIGFDADAPENRRGFGLELVRILTGQLRGSAVFNDPGGACCTIAFRHR
ncbi:MAG TPA: sensor histidine kinase [Spirochaetota bacterium]|nr:sensor histidine kinase [Spirochaetota bacterium]HPC41564.1 sensor histidine kinase [Spirochaetota bacterium]HPL17150.1 sensor histidine kinase [Spirochaetota bacterium]HQF08327.1 sensor histidine kinase [Spirochaetota bacterium]HQH97058.1 sensor histidine kinase [Spirochaetota bacterium]